MPNLAQAIERLYDLHVGVTSAEDGEPHERPHKPLLLLAALDLIDEGLARPDCIPWCQYLRDRFTARFEIVRKHNDQNTPENPFFYLRKDGFWSAWEECSGADNLSAAPLPSASLATGSHAFRTDSRSSPPTRPPAA